MGWLRVSFTALVACLLPHGTAEALPRWGSDPAPPPAPNLKLTITSPTPRGTWTLRVENLAAVPVRLVADARLLSLDVTPPGDGHVVHCSLPPDMRPSDDVDRGLVVPPHHAYLESFDSRLYCFGTHELAGMVPGATVVAHLGWAPPRKGAGRPPFVVSPLDQVEPRVAALKELVSEPWTLAAPVMASTPSTTAPAPTAGPDGDTPPRLTLSLPARLDVARPFELAVPVTLTNDGPRPVRVLFRAATLGFDVDGPGGLTSCRGAGEVGPPVAEVLTTLPPRGKATEDVELTSVCPTSTFDQAGLYVLRPHLDTRHASGSALGLRTFDGEVVGLTTLVLRVREPRVPALAARPKLE